MVPEKSGTEEIAGLGKESIDDLQQKKYDESCVTKNLCQNYRIVLSGEEVEGQVMCHGGQKTEHKYRAKEEKNDQRISRVSTISLESVRCKKIEKKSER